MITLKQLKEAIALAELYGATDVSSVDTTLWGDVEITGFHVEIVIDLSDSPEYGRVFTK